jgi:NTE family protein
MIEQLERRGGAEARSATGLELRRIGMMVILPSRDPAEIARAHLASMPRTLRILLRSMGALNASGRQLISYLMFESTYTRELMSLGYRDAMGRRDQILAFMRGDDSLSTGATTILRRLSGKEERAEAKQ